ncbi:MAG: hypothetical protein CMJ80_06455 [Planctomycetaceae bacterium]|nr:hypothetical protein [Planctomycetaceae bacterium]
MDWAPLRRHSLLIRGTEDALKQAKFAVWNTEDKDSAKSVLADREDGQRSDQRGEVSFDWQAAT